MQPEAPESSATHTSQEQLPPQEPLPPNVPAGPRRLRFWFWLGLILVMLLGGAGVAWWLTRTSDKPSPSQTVTPKTPAPAQLDTASPRTTAEVVVSGRQHIWEIAFLPTGELLFDERGGIVNLIKEGHVREVARIADVQASGEGGLLGLALDSEFSKNRYLYTCYNSTANDIRIVRWRLAEDLASLQDKKTIVTIVALDKSIYLGRHAGCRLSFGPDGYLWVGTGDNARGDTSVQPKNLGGKILRIDRDGQAAPDNLGGEFDSRVYSYGHRNVQGLAFFPAAKNGTLGISTEHGPTTDDEVNELKKGNFGWAPPAAGYDERVPMTDLTRFPDAISAIWSSGSPTVAPAGAAVIHGKAWKGWDGAAAIVHLKGTHLKILRLNAKNEVTKEEKLLEGTYGRLRAIVQGPDGSLYMGSSNGNDDKIIKLAPEKH